MKSLQAVVSKAYNAAWPSDFSSGGRTPAGHRHKKHARNERYHKEKIED
jgi:hypothetical protein